VALDLKHYLSVGPGAYNAEEVSLCDVTYDFLLGKMDDEGLGLFSTFFYNDMPMIYQVHSMNILGIS
jgi:hypothetical protein